jgi:hypothetical protein
LGEEKEQPPFTVEFCSTQLEMLKLENKSQNKIKGRDKRENETRREEGRGKREEGREEREEKLDGIVGANGRSLNEDSARRQHNGKLRASLRLAEVASEAQVCALYSEE